jgi:gliding motility-associated-like protein
MNHLNKAVSYTFNKYLLGVLFICLSGFYAQAQCPNADFETGTFANWQGRTGSCCPINTPTNGIVAGRHTIMAGPGIDPNSCGGIPVVAPGSTFSARLGNAGSGSQAERLIYNFNVTPQSNLIIYKYAVVMESPGDHSAAEQPRFEVRVRDQNGNTIPCTFYQIAAGGNNPTPGFNNCGSWRYKPWTTVGVDVTAYIGQNVSVDFATGDCSLGAHAGYAYIDAACAPLQIDARYCLGNNQAQLDAPVGFSSYLWSTGQTTPSITINNPVQGQQVSCTITSVTGCQATLTATLNPTNPNPAFAIVSNCMGNATFDNNSTVVNGTTSGYSWNFGDGSPADTTTNPVHVYNAPGTYTVTLTQTTDIGCTDVTSQQVQIAASPVAAFATNNACDGQTVTLTDQSTMAMGTINQWNWNLGNGVTLNTQNGNYVYPDTGTYTVQLIVSENGQCPDTTTRTVIVKENPIAAFSTVEVCQGFPNAFTNTSTTYWGNITYNWNFGQNGATSAIQAPSYTYTAPGTFNAQLIITQTNPTHTCSDTLVLPVDVFAVPVAAFTTPQYYCLGEPTVFTNNSTVNPNEPLIYAWNFGDNITSASQSPTHTYANFGTFTSQLIVSTANNCADTTTLDQYIYAIPVAGLTPDVTSGCEPITVNYTGQSTIASGNILSWNWDLGDNTTANIQNPTGTYTNGNYNVSVVVEGGDANHSCYDSANFVLDIYAVPVAAFTSDQYLCLGLATDFTNQSSVSTNEQLVYSWDFGDNTTSALADPSHTYGNYGAFTAQLIVSTLKACADTATAIQNIYAIPTAGIVPDNATGCEPLTVNFTGQGNVALGVITGYAWDLGNNTTSALQNPTTLYPTANTYNVSLVVEAGDLNNYCYDTATTVITVHPLPVADFSTVNACLGDQVEFNNLSTVSSGIIQLYAWDFGDNLGTSIQANPAYLYGTEGQYTIGLTVTTDQGCVHDTTRTLDIYPPPVIDFAADLTSGCAPLVVNFSDLTVLNSGNIAAWRWDFGDGNQSTQQNPTHSYDSAGVYTVSLQVTTNFGCTDIFTITDMITVWPNPVAAFNAQPNPTTEFNPIINFDDQSLGNPTLWDWDFGNGDSANAQNPRFIYDSPGNYTVLLYIENQYGCSDTTSGEITISPEYTFYIPNAFTPNGDGINDQFGGAGTNIKEYEMYIFNRWGEKIFTTFDMNKKWEGYLGKEKVQDEVYVYLVVIKDIFDQPHKYRGTVTMIR